jgi:hypothetical protein
MGNGLSGGSCSKRGAIVQEEKRPSCSRMRPCARLKMKRTRDGDLERLESIRERGRLKSSENTGCKKHSKGRSTRTGWGILAFGG